MSTSKCLPTLGRRVLVMLTEVPPMPLPLTVASVLDGPAPVSRPLSHGTLWHLPASPAEGPRPALLWIHGGGWRHGSGDTFWPHTRYFARRGLVGFSLDYRLVAPGGPTLADALEDCREAVRHLRRHADELGIDPQRIAVAGDSAGGHLAACLGALPAPGAVPDALVLCNPITDLTADPWPSMADGVPIPEGCPAPPADEFQRRWARGFSPLHQVAAPHPRTLLMHGDADRVVPVEQSRAYAQRLRELGIEVRYDEFHGFRHAFVATRWTATEAQVVTAWSAIDQWLAVRGWIAGNPQLALAGAA